MAATPSAEVPTETAGPYPGDGSNGPDVLDDSGIVRHDCDRSGRYSMYDSAIEDENYLRGIAATDSDGTAWFRTIFPACYSGRWPHIRFEVYSSVAKAVANGPIVKTSQIALPKAACDRVYASRSYSGSASNLARTSLSRDMVFGDDKAVHQLATVTGSVKEGYVANLTVGV
jgi:hypothetical protein